MIYETGTVIIAGAGAANASSEWIKMSRTFPVSYTARVTVTAATLQATLRILCTDFDAKSGFEAVNTEFVAAGPLPTGFTYANGVLTANNPPIGTYEIPMTALGVPRFIRAVWGYTSGGGTVALDVALSGWGAA
jgi:hypothetical protein